MKRKKNKTIRKIRTTPKRKINRRTPKRKIRRTRRRKRTRRSRKVQMGGWSVALKQISILDNMKWENRLYFGKRTTSSMQRNLICQRKKPRICIAAGMLCGLRIDKLTDNERSELYTSTEKIGKVSGEENQLENPNIFKVFLLLSTPLPWGMGSIMHTELVIGEKFDDNARMFGYGGGDERWTDAQLKRYAPQMFGTNMLSMAEQKSRGEGREVYGIIYLGYFEAQLEDGCDELLEKRVEEVSQYYSGDGKANYMIECLFNRLSNLSLPMATANYSMYSKEDVLRTDPPCRPTMKTSNQTIYDIFKPINYDVALRNCQHFCKSFISLFICEKSEITLKDVSKWYDPVPYKVVKEYNSTKDGTEYLSLEVGREIVVTDQDDQVYEGGAVPWWEGYPIEYKDSEEQKSGFFPNDHVIITPDEERKTIGKAFFHAADMEDLVWLYSNMTQLDHDSMGAGLVRTAFHSS